MKTTLLFMLAGLFFLQCTAPPLPLTDHFPGSAPDTDTILLQPHPTADSLTHPIPWEKLADKLDFTLFENTPYGIPDTTDVQFRGHWMRKINEEYQLYLLEQQYNWFVFQFLLTYSRQEDRFTDLQTAAAFYGGEGGQVRIEGRLFDGQQNDLPSLLLRRMDHGLIPHADSLMEYSKQFASLLIWENGSFRDIPNIDSSQWINTYPLFW